MLNGKLYIYPNIISLMAINGDTLKTLSKELNIGYQALSARLRGQKSFELPEIWALMNKYKKSFEYLFVKNDEIKQSNVDELDENAATTQIDEVVQVS